MHLVSCWPVLSILGILLRHAVAREDDQASSPLDLESPSACSAGESLLQTTRSLSEQARHGTSGLHRHTRKASHTRRASHGAHHRSEAQTATCEPRPDGIVPAEPLATQSSLHDVVGPDGVLMLSLQRDSSRFDYSAEDIGKAGIKPSKFFATDASCTSQETLNKGCVSQKADTSKEWCSKLKKTGDGCGSKAEQAIGDSHRRALEYAATRKEDWTLILEDDTLLVRPERWDEAFARAWKKVPAETQVVRLSWCMPGNKSQIIQPDFVDAGDFKMVQWAGYSTGYRAGGCTGAYLVHRSVIPEMLGVFPCCCPVDCCLENDLYNRVSGDGKSETRGMAMMLSMDGWGAQEYIEEREKSFWGVQYGVMMQASSQLKSTRTGTIMK